MARIPRHPVLANAATQRASVHPRLPAESVSLKGPLPPRRGAGSPRLLPVGRFRLGKRLEDVLHSDRFGDRGLVELAANRFFNSR